MPVSSKACCIPVIAALTSRMSWEVSINSRSTPPWIRPSACSRNISASSSKLTLESSGSSVEGSFPDGPMEPATKRSCAGRPSFPAWEYSSANLRASPAAVRLISMTRSWRPYSAIVNRLARKVSVSTTSTPTSKNERCTFSTACGKEITR